jgi:asparagine N-glycosylation enzyme membrane subunit Stt3
MILESFKKLDELKRNQIYLLLVAVVILGFSIRYIPFLHKLMIDDTYYQFSITKHILENGRAPQSLVLADFPKGRSIIKDPLLLPYFIAYSYKLSPIPINWSSPWGFPCQVTWWFFRQFLELWERSHCIFW